MLVYANFRNRRKAAGSDGIECRGMDCAKKWKRRPCRAWRIPGAGREDGRKGCRKEKDMVIKEYGDKKLPKIVLLHPMLADGECMLKLTGGMAGRYCFIAPDLSGQGSDRGEFESPEKEARTLTEYLKNSGFGTIELIAGASLGGVVGMLMIAGTDIRYKTAVFDGTPMYENAKLIYWIMKSAFLKKHRKAAGMPPDDVRRAMEEKYGIFGERMAENFIGISEGSLAAIVKACSDFSFPPISEDMQKRIFLEVGSKDINCRQNKVVLRHYPHLHIKVREGYGHCMYPSAHYEEYGQLLERYMNSAHV